jgi:hypothetical protein
MNIENKKMQSQKIGQKWHTYDDGEKETRWRGLKEDADRHSKNTIPPLSGAIKDSAEHIKQNEIPKSSENK